MARELEMKSLMHVAFVMASTLRVARVLQVNTPKTGGIWGRREGVWHAQRANSVKMRTIGIVMIAMDVAYRKHKNVSIAEAALKAIVSAKRATMAATTHINAQSVQ